jgi:hypothetical protein
MHRRIAATRYHEDASLYLYLANSSLRLVSASALTYAGHSDYRKPAGFVLEQPLNSLIHE